ncbi:hypothetical protein [Sandaracinus amylolyticus]|uniref:Uncharacterized protein n=1 Tax=Sandaracinus amylolyticus TaxID=927083 RepID=A0A0F6YLE4_9BACT|nr:hypothetical protein [Sandaracinus amylolyticus]AKF09357.1 hypothetical protein DB32_006506 [Sandaracinus amylolyticus]
MATRKKTAKKGPTSAFVNAARQAKALGDETRAKKLKSLLALIERRKARIVEDFYDIGEALRTILRERLFEQRYASFDALVEQEIGMAPGTAYRLIAVVDALPREKAIELGQEKSYALVTYAGATPEADSPLALADAPIAKSSANEIKRAAAKLRAKKKAASTPKETKALIAKIVAAVRALGLRKPVASLRGKTLTVRVELPE